MVIFHLIQFRMIFILLIFSLIADQVSGQVALIPKLQGGELGKGWTIGRHREQRNPFPQKKSLWRNRYATTSALSIFQT